MRRTFRKFEIPVDVFGKQRYTETDVRSPSAVLPAEGTFPHTPPGRWDPARAMAGRRFARCVRRTSYDSRDL